MNKGTYIVCIILCKMLIKFDLENEGSKFSKIKREGKIPSHSSNNKILQALKKTNQEKFFFLVIRCKQEKNHHLCRTSLNAICLLCTKCPLSSIPT